MLITKSVYVIFGGNDAQIPFILHVKHTIDCKCGSFLLQHSSPNLRTLRILNVGGNEIVILTLGVGEDMVEGAMIERQTDLGAATMTSTTMTPETEVSIQ